MTLEFFLPCVPPTTTHHAKHVIRYGARKDPATGLRVGGFMRLADTPELERAKHSLDALLVPFRPAAPIPGGFGGGLVLTLEFTWPWRAGDTKRVRELGKYPRTTKPDCSNLAKTIEDRLARLRFMDDDALVAELHVRKFFGDEAGILVRLEPLDVPSRYARELALEF